MCIFNSVFMKYIVPLAFTIFPLVFFVSLISLYQLVKRKNPKFTFSDLNSLFFSFKLNALKKKYGDKDKRVKVFISKIRFSIICFFIAFCYMIVFIILTRN
jgi:hypothetical protein